MKRFLAAALLALALAPFHPARAEVDPTLKTIVSIVAAALGEPALNDALPMIDCVRLHGAAACVDVKGIAESQGKQAVKQFVPTDPLIQAAAAIIKAAYNGDWLTVLELTGTDVLVQVACKAGLTSTGPVKGFVCGGVFTKVSNLAKPELKAVLVLVGHPTLGNLLALLEMNIDPTLACDIAPDFPGKSEACGALGELVSLGKDAAKYTGQAAKALWYGAGDILGTNDPKAMSQEDYYALAWAPWYHRATYLCVTSGCSGLGNLEGHIWHPCKDYFASHDMTSSTAQDACDNMRDHKFDPHVKTFAKTMPVAADAYVEVAHPLAKQWAVSDYHNDKALLQDKKTFVQGCINNLVVKFPFPPPDPGRCEAIKQSPLYNNSMLSAAFHQLYSSCVSDAKAQDQKPTVASHVCNAAAPKFVALLNQEQSAIQQKLPGLVGAGCLPLNSSGVKLECDNYAAYNDCLDALSGASAPKAHCLIDQQKADHKIATAIVASLGHKRCQLSGNDVLCSRPWKRQKCFSLRSALASGAPTKVQCKEGPAAALLVFALGVQEAKEIAFTLNGGVHKSTGMKTDKGQGLALVIPPSKDDCKPTWDPLAIGCKGMDSLPQVPGHPKFAYCPHAVNDDGADAPCLAMTLAAMRNATEKTVQVAKPQLHPGAGQNPPHGTPPPLGLGAPAAGGAPVRLGTARPGIGAVAAAPEAPTRLARAAPAGPHLTVAGARAIVEANCSAPRPALVAEVTLRNAGGALAAGAGRIAVKEIGGSGLASQALALPALGAGQTTRPIRLALSTTQPYAELGGKHRLEVILEYAAPVARPYTLLIEVPAGHCSAERPEIRKPLLPQLPSRR